VVTIATSCSTVTAAGTVFFSVTQTHSMQNGSFTVESIIFILIKQCLVSKPADCCACKFPVAPLFRFFYNCFINQLNLFSCCSSYCSSIEEAYKPFVLATAVFHVAVLVNARNGGGQVVASRVAGEHEESREPPAGR